MAAAGSFGENVELVNTAARSGIVLVCEHASNFIPEDFSNLGLDDKTLNSHAAWDPGALAVAKLMSAKLDAPLVATGVSRLVYDCNRPLVAESAIPKKSEIYEIPGNVGLSNSDRAERAERFYQPFRAALKETLDSGIQKIAVISVHSFTPVFHGKPRKLELGILHDEDTRLADALLSVIRQEGSLNARSNDPYGPEDGVTYTLNEHARPRDLLNAMFEIRNDLIADDRGQQAMAERLTGYLQLALSALGANQKKAVSS